MPIKIADILLASINVIDIWSHLIDLLGFHLKTWYFDCNKNIWIWWLQVAASDGCLQRHPYPLPRI